MGNPYHSGPPPPFCKVGPAPGAHARSGGLIWCLSSAFRRRHEAPGTCSVRPWPHGCWCSPSSFRPARSRVRRSSSDPAASATSATPTTTITFTVTYRNREGSAPAYVRVVIDGAAHAMTGDGGDDWKGGVGHHFATKLPVGTHDVSFVAADTRKFTDAVDGGTVKISVPTPTPGSHARPDAQAEAHPTPAPTPTPTPPASGGDTGGARRLQAGGRAAPAGAIRASSATSVAAIPAPAARAARAAAAAPAAPARPDPRRAARPPAGPAIRRSRRRPGAAAPAIPRRTATRRPARRAARPARTIGDGSDAAAGLVAGAGGTGGPGGPSGGPDGSSTSGPGGTDRRRWGVGRRQRLGPARLGARRARPPERSAPTCRSCRRSSARPARSRWRWRSRSSARSAATRSSRHPTRSSRRTPPGPRRSRPRPTSRPPPAPVDLESLMPRWRRPSLQQARKNDPTRSVAVAPRLRFDDTNGAGIGYERRLVRYRVVPCWTPPTSSAPSRSASSTRATRSSSSRSPAPTGGSSARTGARAGSTR